MAVYTTPAATAAAAAVAATSAAFRPFFSPVALPDSRQITPRTERSVCVLFAPEGRPFDFTNILTALARGAYGVLVVANPYAAATQQPEDATLRREMIVLRELLHFIGCDRERVMLSDVSPEDGARYAKVLGDFTEKVQGLGLWFSEDAATGSRWEAWSGTTCGPCQHAPAELSARLRSLAAHLLKTGRVNAVLGWAQGREEIGPLLATTPAQATRLCAGGSSYPNLAAALETARLTGDGPRRIAVVVRPQELRTIRALQRDGRLLGDGFYFIGQGVQPDACDIVLAPAGATGNELMWSELDAIERWPLAERAAFWQAQFANCVQCEGCRSACPFRGYTENVQTAVAPGAAHSQALNARQTACSQVAAALRLAEHCALCASCSSACPQGVPLYLLHQKAARTLYRMA